MSMVAGDIGSKSLFPDGIQVDHLSENTVGHGVRVRGISNGDTPAAGDVGEYIESAASSPASLTTITYSDCNAAPITLPIGVWDVQAVCEFLPGASTTILCALVGIGNASGNNAYGMDAIRNIFRTSFDNWVPGANNFTYCTPVFRAVVASPTTFYCKGWSQFGVSTMTAKGFIRATRVA